MIFVLKVWFEKANTPVNEKYITRKIRRTIIKNIDIKFSEHDSFL